MDSSLAVDMNHSLAESAVAPPPKKRSKLVEAQVKSTSTSSISVENTTIAQSVPMDVTTPDVKTTNPSSTSLSTNGSKSHSQQQLSSSSSSSSRNNNHNNHRTKKHIRKKHMNPQVLELRRQIQIACGTNNLPMAIQAYHKATNENIRLEPQSFYNLLSLCDGLGDRSVHIGTPKTPKQGQQQAQPLQPNNNNDDTTTTTTKKDTLDSTNESTMQQENKAQQQQQQDTIDTSSNMIQNKECITAETRLNYAIQIRTRMKELKFPLTETAYTALVRLYSKTHHLDQAKATIVEAETVPQCKPKLRMYSSLLRAYCDTNQLLSALELWKQLVVSSSQRRKQQEKRQQKQRTQQKQQQQVHVDGNPSSETEATNDTSKNDNNSFAVFSDCPNSQCTDVSLLSADPEKTFGTQF